MERREARGGTLILGYRMLGQAATLSRFKGITELSTLGHPGRFGE